MASRDVREALHAAEGRDVRLAFSDGEVVVAHLAAVDEVHGDIVYRVLHAVHPGPATLNDPDVFSCSSLDSVVMVTPLPEPGP